MGPPAGARVIEMGSAIAGPFRGQILGDLGAGVIKSEPRGVGDPMRQWGRPAQRGIAVAAGDRPNKMSFALDLRDAEGQRLARSVTERRGRRGVSRLDFLGGRRHAPRPASQPGGVMPADPYRPAANESQESLKALDKAAEHGHRAFDEVIAAAERTIADAAKAAERALRDAVERLRDGTRGYSDSASQHFDEAQRYVRERVRERPMTAAAAGLGLGVLLGLLLSNRAK